MSPFSDRVAEFHRLHASGCFVMTNPWDVGSARALEQEGGHADDPQQVHANVTLAADTGVAGLSIEDFTGDESSPLHDFELAVERAPRARPSMTAVRGSF